MKDQGLVFEIQRMSTEDGPGIRTTVFMKQCPLKCIWCHNPESILKQQQIEWFEHKCIGCRTCIEICPLNALLLDQEGMQINREKCNLCFKCVEECPSTALSKLGEWWSLKDLFNEINKDKIYYSKSNGGITVSGGEPTSQYKFVLEFFRKCKENDISTALDTCGYAREEIYQLLLPHVDLVLFDIKEINPERHKEFTGASNKRILKNAIWISDYLKNNGKKMWVRTPIIPKYTATDDNIEGIGIFIMKELCNIPERWDLLAFNNLCKAKYERLNLVWPLEDQQLMSKEKMEHFYKIAKNTGVQNPRWSGLTKKSEFLDDNTKDINKQKVKSC